MLVNGPLERAGISDVSLEKLPYAQGVKYLARSVLLSLLLRVQLPAGILNEPFPVKVLNMHLHEPPL